MVRYLITLALLLLPSLALAYEQAVLQLIWDSTRNQPGQNQEHMRERAIKGVMDKLGIKYDEYRGKASRTLNAKNSVHYRNNDRSTAPIQYDGTVIGGWQCGWNGDNPGFFPDSITRINQAGWPTKPLLLLGSDGEAGTKWTNDASECSTGVNNNSAGETINHRYVYYSPDYPELVWKGSGVTRHARQGAAIGGVWRPIIAYASSPTPPVENWDDYTRPAVVDSPVVWVRYRSPGPQETAPIFHVNWMPSGGDLMLLAHGFAAMDSAIRAATGKILITKPFMISLVVDGFYRTSHYNAYSSATNDDTLATGIFCATDSCDTLNLKNVVNSMNEFKDWKGNPVPIGFGVEPESLKFIEKSYNTRIIKSYKGHYVALSPSTGTRIEAGVTNASSAKLYDVLGHARLRYILPGGVTSLPYTCTESDTGTVYCLTKWAKARADSLFPGRVSGILVPAGGDFTPTTITKNRHMAFDTLKWALSDLGIKGAVAYSQSVHNNIGSTRLPLGPIGWSTSPLSQLVKRPGTIGPYTGKFALLGSRSTDEIGPRKAHLFQAAHDIRSEEKWGMFLSDWYRFHDKFHGVHIMWQRTNVIKFHANAMAGYGAGTFVSKHGYWTFKWYNAEINLLNKLAGREIARIVTLDELAANQ